MTSEMQTPTLQNSTDLRVQYHQFFNAVYALYFDLMAARNDVEVMNVALNTMCLGAFPLITLRFTVEAYQTLHQIYEQFGKDKMLFAYINTHLVINIIYHIRWGIPHLLLSPEFFTSGDFLVPPEYIKLIAAYYCFPVSYNRLT